jgi:hypothetical protein
MSTLDSAEKLVLTLDKTNKIYNEQFAMLCIILKVGAPFIVSPITYILNKALSKRHFPWQDEIVYNQTLV